MGRPARDGVAAHRQHGERVAEAHQRSVQQLADRQQHTDSEQSDRREPPRSHRQVHQQQPGEQLRQRRGSERHSGESLLARRAGKKEKRGADEEQLPGVDHVLSDDV